MKRTLIQPLLPVVLTLLLVVLPGCYTQFETTESEPEANYQGEDTSVSSEPPVSTEDYEDARYRFYFSAGYPYGGFGFSVGYYDPWFWGSSLWYPYPYWYYGWSYPVYAYPPGWCCGYYPGYDPGYWPVYRSTPGYYAARTFGTTRSLGATRVGIGGYRPAAGVTTYGSRPTTTGGRSATPTRGTTGRQPRVDTRATGRSGSVGALPPGPPVSTGRRGNTVDRREPVKLQPVKPPASVGNEGESRNPNRGERVGSSRSTDGSSYTPPRIRSGGDNSGVRPSTPARSSPPPSGGNSGGGARSSGSSRSGGRR